MHIKSLTGVTALGSPSGEVTPDDDGVFNVDHVTGAHLIQFGGWEEVEPPAVAVPDVPAPTTPPTPAPPAVQKAPAAPTPRAPRKSRAKPRPATK